MADDQQFGLEEWDLARYESFVHDNVEALRDRYRKRARINRLCFRGVGIVVILLSSCAEWPSAARRCSNRRHLADDPMRPIEPRCEHLSAASQSATSSAWSWVMTST